MHILVTGGAGYIGCHTVLALCEAGFDPVIIDNFCNSHPAAIERVKELANRPYIPVVCADVADTGALERVFSDYPIGAVIHFAGYKAVGESVSDPLKYYGNNIKSTLALLHVMAKRDCFRFVFSSSATVYGQPEVIPIPEAHRLSATNPYGRTKLFQEEILRDLAFSDPRWHIVLLRYFNPAGAHPSGRIGEDPSGPPNNLFPCITQFLGGRRPELRVLGTDYPTRDGSGVRDYLHVCDLAEGHVSALKNIDGLQGVTSINLGTGTGCSVLEIIQCFEQVTARSIPYVQAPRRAGDVAECIADPARAHDLLKWRASRSLRIMCEDSWRWQQLNPAGYFPSSLYR